MSNLVISPFYKAHKHYPIFKPEQVLSESHLNDLRDYLDEEIKQTRAGLIGMGIANGFDYRWVIERDNDNKELAAMIEITSGLGVTSNGQLITSNYEQKKLFDRMVDYTPDAKMPPILGMPEGAKFKLLIPKDAVVVDGVASEALLPTYTSRMGCGLIMYNQIVETQVKSCFVTTCDERGAQKKFSALPLLVVTDTRIPIKAPEPTPVFPGLKRLTFPALNNPKLAQQYEMVLTDKLLEEIGRKIGRFDQVLKPLFEDAEMVNLPGNAGVLLKEMRKALKDDDMQYFYDFIGDLRKTVLELYDLLDQNEPVWKVAQRHYPNQLTLGPLHPWVGGFDRSDFQEVKYDHEVKALLTRMHRLWRRVHHLIGAFGLPQPDNKVQITPSFGVERPLSVQSLPFFYGKMAAAPLHRFWSDHGNPERILSYHNRSFGNNNDEQFTTPLLFEHEDKPLLLVEGLVGMQKKEAINSILGIQERHHLPFAVVALRVSKTNHSKPYPEPQGEERPVPEYNFKEFVLKHPGLSHGRGVLKGGTLAIIFKAGQNETEGMVSGFLVLPYLCCGIPQKPAPDPDPIVLLAKRDDRTVQFNKWVDIKSLDNDDFDPQAPIEVDFIYPLQARKDKASVTTDRVIDIPVVNNDQYDPNLPVEVDFVHEFQAQPINAVSTTARTVDIDVLKENSVDPGQAELDFAKDN